ncbi:LCP family protein [Peterkaempfera sp. SMS 1(5)a]|uniref:LCP family protein n=1 Tax=Peterkaempfera podocarpi TaxID=3232308 RepID=UPI00366FE1BC
MNAGDGRMRGASGNGPDWSDGGDPADQWVLDPATGNYRLRTDGPGPGRATTARRPGVPQQGRPGPRRPAGPGGGAPAGDSGRLRAPSPGGTPPGIPAQGGDTHPGIPAQGGGRAAARRARTGQGSASEAPAETAVGGRAARRKAGKTPTRSRRVLKWTAWTGAFVLVAGCAGGYYAYQHLNGNITGVNVNLGDEAKRPKAATKAVNILVIGTDSRQGLGKKYGDAGSVGHADTTFLFHVSADRTNATAISIPRDLMVPIPECTTGGKTIPGSARAMFNTSLGQDDRDPGCTWKTVEQMTGVRIDHFVEVNFEAVKTISTAVGGVEVCAAKDLVDPQSHLNMTKGKHVIEGDEALAFVRTRHAVGFGGDLTRIPLQQQFISGLIRKVKSDGTLTSPSKLWSLANAATKALTVDQSIASVLKLKDLAQDLGTVDTKHITFATAPVLDDPTDKNRLVLKEPDATQLFAMVAADKSLTKVTKKTTASTAPSPAATTKAAPADVRVTVKNGSGVTGLAQATVDWMQNTEGYLRSSNGANGPATAKTTLYYAPNHADQARTLAAAMGLPASQMKATTQYGTGAKDPMLLILGKDFKQPGVSLTVPTAAPSNLQRVEADDTNVCAK